MIDRKKVVSNKRNHKETCESCFAYTFSGFLVFNQIFGGMETDIGAQKMEFESAEGKCVLFGILLTTIE